MVQAFASVGVGLPPQSVLNLQGPPPPAAPAAAAPAAQDAFQAQAPQAQAPAPQAQAQAPQAQTPQGTPDGVWCPPAPSDQPANGLLQNIGKVIESLGSLLKSIGDLFQGLGGTPNPGQPPQPGDQPGNTPPPIGDCPAPGPITPPTDPANPVKDFVEKELPAKIQANPKLAREINAPIQLQVTGPQGGTWTVDFTKNSDWVHAGAQGTPKMTVTVSDGDFNKLRNGQLDPTAAVMDGKLKFEPFDMGLAQKIGDLLK